MNSWTWQLDYVTLCFKKPLYMYEVKCSKIEMETTVKKSPNEAD